MKTRIISQLLIAGEKNTWAILRISCNYHLKSICNRIHILFFTFPKLTPFFINENKNYLSIINCTRKGYVDHFMYINNYRLKNICNRIRIRFFRFLFSELAPEERGNLYR